MDIVNQTFPDATAPDQAVLNQVAAAVASSKYHLASELADAEIARGRIHPALFSARAFWLEEQQRFADALREFQRARALSLRDVTLLNAIGLCLTRLYRLSEAIDVFDEAIRLDPTYASSYHRKGIALGMTGDLDGAQRAHERVLALFPRNDQALACLASVLVRKGEFDRARDYARRALKLDPQQGTAIAALAMAENADGDFVSAEERVRPLLKKPEISGRGRASAWGILADALDGQNRTGEAFAAYSAENSELEQYHAVRFAGRIQIREFAAALATRFEQITSADWPVPAHSEAVDGAATGHIFLLGFFRSGTTLLEQVLQSHPDVVTLEEKDVLALAAERYLTNRDGVAALVALSGDELAAARADYWQGVRKLGLDVSGKVMVDKNPLNTLKLPLVARLFPNARIILALRDPRDVVLSCFRRHFEINAAMYELLTLEGASTTYDAVMRLAEVMRARLPLTVHEHRYEHLVDDFEESVGEICRFIGVSFRKEMLEFHLTAKTQDIRSPSAPQVRRTLYRESIAQWRRYAAQLEPVRPILEPWVARFGYSAE
jgi:tetratricopeptide (TPR) repeat protein